MRLVVQRVRRASVSVRGQPVARIGAGVVVFVAVGRTDTAHRLGALAESLMGLRMCADERGRLARSVEQTGGEVLVVPQITLLASARGRRLSFDAAAPVMEAQRIFDAFTQALRARYPKVAVGVFQEHMLIELVNDGPVTLVLDEPSLTSPDASVSV